MLRIVNENISRLENKDYTLYFYVLDTKGNPSSSLEYIYHTAYVLSQRGHKVAMIHQEKEFEGVGSWLGEEYAKLPHMNIETENVEISPSDFIFIPEIFTNVMLQIRKLPCKKVAIVQNYGNITEFLPVSQTLDGLGIIDVITTCKYQSDKVKEYFPMVRTYEVSPSIRPVFRNNETPRKLIVNVVAKDQSDANKIVKPFYWKNPAYRWVTFRDLRGLPNEVMAEALREAAITIWVDDKTDLGLSLVEAARCGSLVVAKVPDTPKEWMIEGDNLTDSILWFNDLDDASNILASIVRSWTTDTVPAELYEKQTRLDSLYTEKAQVYDIIEVYEKSIIGKRLKDFQETKIEVENNTIKSKEE